MERGPEGLWVQHRWYPYRWRFLGGRGFRKLCTEPKYEPVGERGNLIKTDSVTLNLFLPGSGGRDPGGFWPQMPLSAVIGKD